MIHFLNCTDGDGDPVLVPVQRIIWVEAVPTGHALETNLGVKTLIRVDSQDTQNGAFVIKVRQTVTEIDVALRNCTGSGVIQA